MTLLIGLPAGSEWLLILFTVISLLVPFVFYLVTLQNTLAAVSPENRTMSPGNVWLLLIPVFGLIWHFFVVNSLADSIKAEAASRNIKLGEERPRLQYWNYYVCFELLVFRSGTELPRFDLVFSLLDNILG